MIELQQNLNPLNQRQTLEYYVLDVFSSQSYKGNPLSVVIADTDLGLETYGKIAREFGYSETSFIEFDRVRNVLRVRSFTPIGYEVDGAGHNLLGAVCAAIYKDDTFFDRLETEHSVLMKDAVIPLTIDFGADLPGVQMRQKPVVLKQPLSPVEIAPALNLNAEDLNAADLVPTVAKTEVAHAMIPVRNAQVLNGMKPDSKMLVDLSRKYGFEGFYCFTLAGENEAYIAETRFFNPIIGIDEDAATGTAAGPLTGFLAARRLLEPNRKYYILQGVKLNQPSLIAVTATDNGILVGGSSVITMKGHIYI